MTTPLPITAADITVPPAILALPFTGAGVALKTAADTAGFAGSHFYGRGTRQAVQTFTNLYPPYTGLTDCKLSVEGGDLVLSAGGQTTRVAYTPRLTLSYNGVDYYSVNAGVDPRSLYGDTRNASFVGVANDKGAADSITMFIANGVVTDVTAKEAATNTIASCGGTLGGNLNTDRSLDALSLPTALVAQLKTAAVASGSPAAQTKTVVAADLTGFAATINFGRGIYATNNADFTIKEVTRVNDCKVEVKNGILRMTSAQAAYDHSFTINSLAYSAFFNKEVMFVTGRETADITSAPVRLTINFSTATPYVSAVDSPDVIGKQTMVCPRG